MLATSNPPQSCLMLDTTESLQSASLQSSFIVRDLFVIHVIASYPSQWTSGPVFTTYTYLVPKGHKVRPRPRHLALAARLL